jgi:hypothetical protein
MLCLAQNDESVKHLKHKLLFGSGGYLTYLMGTSKGGKGIDGWDAIRHSYNNYCYEFRNLFYAADVTGILWEHASFINSWKFYALSEEKFHKTQTELSHN